MIVVAIIGLLAALAVPAYSKQRKRTQATAYVSDLRVAVAAFQLYALEQHGYPPDRMPGQVPPGMAEYLGPRFRWTEETPIGGRWDWDDAQFGYRAGVSVYQPFFSATDMMLVDSIIDDGNLATGVFRSRANGYIYLIEE